MALRIFLVGILIISLGARAEDSSVSAEVEQGEEASGLGAWVELRPSWNSSENSMHSENEVGIEYRYHPDRAVGYTQEFFFRFNQPLDLPQDQYYRTRFGEGYLWGDWAKVMDLGSHITLGYEPRLYFPTSGLEQEPGTILSTRQILKVDWEATPIFGLSFYEVPIFFWRNKAGYESEDGPIANYSFENRMEFGPQLTLLREALKISVPLVFQARRHNNYQPDASMNNTWSYSLWLSPEVIYKLTESTSIGVAYYSDTFIDEGFRQTDVSGGLNKGTFQMVLQQSM